MSKKHLSVTVSEECYDIIMTYRDAKGLTLSKSVEELIDLGNRERATQEQSIKDCLLGIMKLSDRAKELMKAKNKVMS